LNEFAEVERLKDLNVLNGFNNGPRTTDDGHQPVQKKAIDRVARLALKSDGFTLIEVILIIVMVSVFMAAIMLPFISSLRESDLPEIASIAYFLALEKLEELSAQTAGSISDEAKAAVSGYGDYEREVTVTDVACDDLSTSDPDSGCRKVLVTVYHSKIPDGVSLVTLRTAY
jgi:type II secretory pathway pseudopilin PulG